MSSPFSEYPKWVRSNGRETIVADAEAEAAQLAAWAGITPVATRQMVDNRLMTSQPMSAPGYVAPAPADAPRLSQLDHDGDGKPGGSTAPDEDVADLRKTYQAKFGKRPFPGWKADKLKSMIEAA